MKTSPIVRTVIIIVLVALNIYADQLTKSIAREQLEYHKTIEIIGEYFVFNKVENAGAFLGFGSDIPPVLKEILLLGLPALVMIFMLGFALYKTEMDWLSTLGLACLAGGGIGNLYDRFIYGTVTDFLFIDFGLVRTGVFNIADISVMIGIGLVFLQSARGVGIWEKDPAPKPSSPDPKA